MPSPSALSPIELEVGRIRELSKDGRHCEALAAAEALALAAPQNRNVLYLIATRTFRPASLVGQTVEALLVLGGASVAAFLPGIWCAARRFDGIAAAAAAGLWGTVVFAACDIAILRPLKAYPWTWDAIGGGSTWWYLPVWWMLGTFIAWMGGIRIAASAARGRPGLLQMAGPVWITSVAVAALARGTGTALLPVATGLGFCPRISAVSPK